MEHRFIANQVLSNESQVIPAIQVLTEKISIGGRRDLWVIESERTAVIAAPPDKVYAIIGNPKRFNEWSPWSELDPNLTYIFAGPEQGVGQKMSWKSNDPEVGSGAVTITEAVTGEKITTELDFGEMGKSRSVLTVSKFNDGTLVAWTFRAEVNSIMERWTGLMFDKWIGADYVKGLGKLKVLAEKEAQVPVR